MRSVRAIGMCAAALAATLAACGVDQQRTALAVEVATRDGEGVTLSVECAEAVEVTRRPDPAGSGLEEITVWGEPRLGRCTSTETVELDADRFVDGASSQVVEVTTDDGS